MAEKASEDAYILNLRGASRISTCFPLVVVVVVIVCNDWSSSASIDSK